MDSNYLKTLSYLKSEGRSSDLKELFKTDEVFIASLNYILLDLRISSLDKFNVLKKLSASVLSELWKKRYHEPTDFDPTPLQEAFRNYFYEHTLFSDKIIPFEEWSDIAEEVMLILQSLLNEKKLNRYLFDSRYEAMGNKFNQRLHELADKGYTNLLELSGR